MTLTVADIERWDGGDVRDVFHAATSRAQAAFDAADRLATLPAFTTWGGEAAEAAQDAIGQTRKDLDARGNEVLAVGIVALGLVRFGRNRILRTVGLALVVAPVSGWLIVASLGVTHH